MNTSEVELYWVLRVVKPDENKHVAVWREEQSKSGQYLKHLSQKRSIEW